MKKVKHNHIALFVVVMLFITSMTMIVGSHVPLITGAVTGQTNVTVINLVQITIINNSIALGALQPGQQNSTNQQLQGLPMPFVVNNSGNVDVNISVYAAQLFTTRSAASSAYMIECGNASGGGTTAWGANCTNLGGIATINDSNWAQMPLSSGLALNYSNLSFQTRNQIFFHINVTVPAQEPTGNKTSTVTFTASAAY